MQELSAAALLPADVHEAILVGRIWRNTALPGPSVVIVRGGEVFDITPAVGTVADLLERPDLLDFARTVPGESLGSVQRLLAEALAPGSAPVLLAPCDVQAIKA
jgi:fumarylacetoacetate (FAA) hydrolase family protein